MVTHEYEFIIQKKYMYSPFGNEIYTKEKIANIPLQNTSKIILQEICISNGFVLVESYFQQS